MKKHEKKWDVDRIVRVVTLVLVLLTLAYGVWKYGFADDDGVPMAPGPIIVEKDSKTGNSYTETQA